VDVVSVDVLETRTGMALDYENVQRVTQPPVGGPWFGGVVGCPGVRARAKTVR
jgi:hypothetical protein